MGLKGRRQLEGLDIGGEKLYKISQFEEALSKKETLQEIIRKIATSDDIERFFYGHGKDELVERIEKAKEEKENSKSILKGAIEELKKNAKENENSLKILKEADEKLDAISEQIPNIDINVAKNTEELLELLNSDVADITLSKGEFEIVDFDFVSDKNIIGSGKDWTRLAIGRISLKASLTIKDTIICPLNNKKTEITGIEENGGIYLCNVEQDNIDLERNFKIRRFKDFGIFEDESGFIFDETIEINNKELNIRNVNFISNTASGFIFTGCTGKIENCSFSCSDKFENKEDQEFSFIDLRSSDIKIENSEIKNVISGIYADKSKISVVNTNIHDCLDTGIAAVDNSFVSLLKSNIFKNKANGIYLNSSNLSIEGSDVYANGTEGKTYPQIVIGSSKADITNTEIHDSLGGTGIYGIDKSAISLKAAAVFKNKSGGIDLKGASNLSIEGSDVYANGTEGKTHPQIFIESSKADITNTKIHDSLGGDGINGRDKSDISLKAAAVFKNKYNGIDLKSSNLSIEGSSITENGTNGKYYQQIYLGFSTANIKNSKVGNGFSSSNSIGVEEHSNLILEGSKVDILYYDPRAKLNVKNDCNIAELYKTLGILTINNNSLF